MIRSHLPFFAKALAITVFIGVAALLGVQLIKKLNPVSIERDSRVKLQGQLTAVFDNFEYVHHENGRNRYKLTALKDQVFGDGHHELSQVKLEVYDKVGAPAGQVTAEHCRYDQAQALVRFERKVFIETTDGLQVKTESLDYDQRNERAETEDKVEFARDRVHGNCRGMLLDSPAQRLEMKAAVQVIVEPAKEETIDSATPGSKASNGKEQPKEKSDQKKDKKPTVAKSGNGLTNKSPDVPVEITGNWGEYTGKDRVIRLRGNARVAEPDRFISATALTVFLSEKKQVERLEARGQALLESRQATAPSRIQATDMDFFFDPTGNLTRAEARGQAQAETEMGVAQRRLNADRLELFALPGASGSEVQHIKALGNVHLKLDAPTTTASLPNATIKELAAQEAELFYFSGGRFIREAQARGAVVLTMTPVSPTDNAERRTLKAERATLTFFETDNVARDFVAQGGVRIEAVPYKQGAATRVTESARAQATFQREGGAITVVVQEGDFKYQEGGRQAVAERATYTTAEERIELREGKVMVWDETVRTQADEIDIYTVKKQSWARGRVRSTYYNPGSIGQAAPFRNMRSPVFITAKEARADHTQGEAIYIGEARAWQDDSFIRSDRLELYRDKRRMAALGNVSSALYQTAHTRDDGGKRVVPVFATSDTMNYSDTERIAEYRSGVKMRQGEDTLEAQRVKIFLKAEVNEVERMEADEQVVLTQPGRRAEGDKAEYTAAEERTVIVGNMARVVSIAQGTITGRRLTLMGGDDKIFADDQRGTKRVRSTHEVQR
ncbi:MAG: LPS export ABC transporter periplasmic protein LptC [Acidobacteriota bacterium]